MSDAHVTAASWRGTPSGERRGVELRGPGTNGAASGATSIGLTACGDRIVAHPLAADDGADGQLARRKERDHPFLWAAPTSNGAQTMPSAWPQ